MIQFLISHIEIDIVALLLAIFGLFSFFHKKQRTGKDDGTQRIFSKNGKEEISPEISQPSIKIENASNIAIDHSTVSVNDSDASNARTSSFRHGKKVTKP